MLGDSVEVWTEKSILYWFVEGRNSYRHAKISKIALAPQNTKIGYSSFKFKHYLQACTTSDKNVETLHARQPVENYRAPTPTVLKGSFNTARAFFIFTLSDAKGGRQLSLRLGVGILRYNSTGNGATVCAAGSIFPAGKNRDRDMLGVVGAGLVRGSRRGRVVFKVRGKTHTPRSFWHRYGMISIFCLFL